MKHSFIFLLAVLFSAQLFGQTTEYSAQLTSGFFSFRGSDAQSSTFYNAGTMSPLTGYTNNPYGRQSGFSYGIALQIQRVTNWHFIYGIQAGYESLSSKVKINDAWTSETIPTHDSKTILTNRFINLHPFIGGRMNIVKGISTDLTFGADFGFCKSSREKATLKTSYGTSTASKDRHNPGTDTRLRVDLTNYYKHFGLTIGYSYGQTNYEAGMIGGSPEVYSQMIRLGLVFKL